MRSVLFSILILAAGAAFAQNNVAPMVVIGGDKDTRPASEIEQQRLINNFPEWAVSRVGAATNGSDKDVPASPAAPANPAAAPSAPSAPTPPVPAAPTAPASKLWPADTVPIFMRPCVGFQPKLVIPCNCVITKLMLAMPHDEFLKLTAQGTIEQDVRLQNIRTACAADAASRQAK